MKEAIKDYLSIRIFSKLFAMLAGFLVLLVALIWVRASLVWGTDTSLQWVWFALALVAGVSSLWAAVREVSTKTLWILIGVDFILCITIWWL